MAKKQLVRNKWFSFTVSVSKNEPRIKTFEKLFRIKESRNSFLLKLDSNQRIEKQSFRFTDSNSGMFIPEINKIIKSVNQETTFLTSWFEKVNRATSFFDNWFESMNQETKFLYRWFEIVNLETVLSILWIKKHFFHQLFRIMNQEPVDSLILCQSLVQLL